MHSHDVFDHSHEDLQLVDRAANNYQNEEYSNRLKLYELNNAINSTDKDKACGADYLHNQFLIHLPENKITQLLGIFNRIWRYGEVPDDWKLGLIIPILKPGKNPQLSSSYRPISLLSCISKLMEKIIHDRLVYTIETRNILSPTQYGFRIRRSTVEPIISLEHQIGKGLVKKKNTIVVFFDLKAAFDTVDHMY